MVLNQSKRGGACRVEKLDKKAINWYLRKSGFRFFLISSIDNSMIKNWTKISNAHRQWRRTKHFEMLKGTNQNLWHPVDFCGNYYSPYIVLNYSSTCTKCEWNILTNIWNMYVIFKFCKIVIHFLKRFQFSIVIWVSCRNSYFRSVGKIKKQRQWRRTKHFQRLKGKRVKIYYTQYIFLEFITILR